MMKQMCLLALVTGTLGLSQFANASDSFACDVMKGVTDSFGSVCPSETFSVVVLVPDERGELKWNLYEQTCYNSEADANTALSRAKTEGLCK